MKTHIPDVPERSPNGALNPPVFIRLPQHGREPITGLSRTKLCQLILPCEENAYQPPVRSVSLKNPGARRGVRLVHLESLLQYLNGQLLSPGNLPQ